MDLVLNDTGRNGNGASNVIGGNGAAQGDGAAVADTTAVVTAPAGSAHAGILALAGLPARVGLVEDQAEKLAGELTQLRQLIGNSAREAYDRHLAVHAAISPIVRAVRLLARHVIIRDRCSAAASRRLRELGELRDAI
jgi:hypothetical protein